MMERRTGETMNAQEIRRLLEEPTENGLPIKRRIIDEAPLAELISALHEPKTADTYEILCEILIPELK